MIFYSFLYKILYLVLIILSLTIINWTWVQEIDNREVYLYDINQVEGKPIGDKLYYFSLLSIVIGTGILFWVDSHFKYYDIIIGYLIWKMIPFISY